MQYTELLVCFPPRLIRSEKEYWETQAVMDKLIDQGDLSEAQQDYLSLLGMLIERYDEEHQVFPELRGIDLIKALLTELGITQKDLLPIFKTEFTITAILSGRRKLTLEHSQGLAQFFHLPQHLFYEEATHVLDKTSLRPFEPVEYAVR